MCTAVFAPKIALLTSPAAFSAGMESQGDKRRAGQGTRARAEKDQLAQRKAERRALATHSKKPKRQMHLAQAGSNAGSRRQIRALQPAGWIPRPWDETPRYIIAVLAASPDPDGIARFRPTIDSARSDGWQCAAYTIVRVAAIEAQQLVDTVAPGLMDTLQLELGGRDVAVEGEKPLHISVEIILSQTQASSGAHYDDTPSILVPIVGKRTVWCAQKAQFADAPRGNADSFLHPELDPADSGPKEGWTEHSVPPGCVVYLPRRDWHSVRSEARSIALSVSVRPIRGFDEAGLPDLGCRRGVAPTEPVAGGWSSPRAFARMWDRSGRMHFKSY